MIITVFSLLVGLTAGLPFRAVNFDCSSAQGMVWWGCGSYGLCQGGSYSQIDCVNGTVYNRQQQQCSDPIAAPYPCGNPPPDCSQFLDSPGHRLPDNQPDTFDNRPPCSYYYTCSYGRFLGYQACPEDTVYDQQEQRCNEPQLVPPPCGYGPVREEGQGGGGDVFGQNIPQDLGWNPNPNPNPNPNANPNPNPNPNAYPNQNQNQNYNPYF